MTLAHVARRQDLAVHDDERAASARRLTPGDAHRVGEVRCAVRDSRAPGRLIAPTTTMGRLAGHGEMKKPRELFERVGAARDHHAVEIRVCRENRDQVAREPGAVVERERRARHVGERFRLQPSEAFGMREARDQLFAGEPSRRSVRNRASRRDDADARLGSAASAGSAAIASRTRRAAHPASRVRRPVRA